MSVWNQFLSLLSAHGHKKNKLVQNRLLEETGLSWKELVGKIENSILENEPKYEPITSNAVVLGGSNNLGFIEHSSTAKDVCLLSKVAYSEQLVRERAFLQWHHESIAYTDSFSADLIVCGVLNETKRIEFLTTTRLKTVKKPNDELVWNLYSRSEAGIKFFSDMYKDVPHLIGNSRIKDVLNNVVCNEDKLFVLRYLKQFFEDRRPQFMAFKSEMEQCENEVLGFYNSFPTDLVSSFGFVHGDFKSANMLETESGQLMLIDLQYYGKGFREWDLAFFLSKKKASFNRVFPFFAEQLSSDDQRKRLAFFYILAMLLHPKPEKFLHIFKHNLEPAINYLKT